MGSRRRGAVADRPFCGAVADRPSGPGTAPEARVRSLRLGLPAGTRTPGLADVLHRLGVQARTLAHRLRQGACGRWWNAQLPVEQLRGGVDLGGFGVAEPERGVDELPPLQVAPVSEGHGDTFAPGSP